MACKIKLKTGFYKTTDVYITVENKSIILSPVNSLSISDIIISDEDIIEITIINKKNKSIQFELYTNKKLYTASFILNASTNEVKNVIRKLILDFNKKIIIEKED